MPLYVFKLRANVADGYVTAIAAAENVTAALEQLRCESFRVDKVLTAPTGTLVTPGGDAFEMLVSVMREMPAKPEPITRELSVLRMRRR